MGHHVEGSGVLSVGSLAGGLEEADDWGVLVSVQSTTGSVELRFFPWRNVVTIVATVG